MRFPKPFFRQSEQAWHLQLGKRQISLGKDRGEAFLRYQEILFHEHAVLPATASQLTVSVTAPRG